MARLYRDGATVSSKKCRAYQHKNTPVPREAIRGRGKATKEEVAGMTVAME
ncbi:MAG: hypothetical protein IKA80_01655 [Spirochaetaceae bacterium]|nr:hypothetical protein [Spirochaetaceae bacterium]